MIQFLRDTGGLEAQEPLCVSVRYAWLILCELIAQLCERQLHRNMRLLYYNTGTGLPSIVQSGAFGAAVKIMRVDLGLHSPSFLFLV
jgi:hypothetical protein